jgi:hypothetical protein
MGLREIHDAIFKGIKKTTIMDMVKDSLPWILLKRKMKG